MEEAKKQYDNYDKLFAYMNQQTDWNVDVSDVLSIDGVEPKMLAIPRLNMERWAISSDNWYMRAQPHRCRATWATFSPMPTERIITGAVITLPDRFSNEWTESSNPISGRQRRRSWSEIFVFVVMRSRASEILFSLAHARMLEEKSTGTFASEALFNKLVRARRNLGLFQHHDGVTGTAKDHVVNDYGTK